MYLFILISIYLSIYIYLSISIYLYLCKYLCIYPYIYTYSTRCLTLSLRHECVWCAGSTASVRKDAFSGVTTAKSRRLKGSRLQKKVFSTIHRRATPESGHGTSSIPREFTRQLSDRVTSHTPNLKSQNPKSKIVNPIRPPRRNPI